jgi:UDP-2,4-diacetamido-2,4,6-trideoxy-beta-L-altropyranose hydrolase
MRLTGQVVAFRADASLRLGMGHVMRCLTLADELRRQGAACLFLCEEQPGDMTTEIGARGYPVHVLHAGAELASVDVMVVDHYSIGEAWETAVRSCCRYVVVLDDLADRNHNCDLLIDQNLGRTESHYLPLVPPGCRILTGSDYAMLRAEFAGMRDYSLRRREPASLRRVFIFMGGVDRSNITGKVLGALRQGDLPPGASITVVLGPQAPWAEQVRQEAARLPWGSEVRVDPQDMAQLMADSDLAVGAAGGAAWERCCLGLPSLIIPIADNQLFGAKALSEANAAYNLGDPDALPESLPRALAALRNVERLTEMGACASRLVDGLGAARVCEYIGELLERS